MAFNSNLLNISSTFLQYFKNIKIRILRNAYLIYAEVLNKHMHTILYHLIESEFYQYLMNSFIISVFIISF